MAGLAEALDPQPEPNTLAYWMKPLTGYLNRQRKLAQEGSDYASQGTDSVRQGDLSGLAGMLLGPLGYVSSPINALIPTEEEAYAAFDSNTAPFVAGGLGAASMFLPGSKKGMRPRGLADLVDDVTPAERAALQQRLQAEAGQTGGVANATTRDQALTNLTEAPPEGITAYHGSPQGGLVDRIKAGWGKVDETRSAAAELETLSASDVADVVKALGMKPAANKKLNIAQIGGKSMQAFRDADIAEQIKRGR